MNIDSFNHEAISRKELKKINGGAETWEWLGGHLGNVIIAMRKTMEAIGDASQDMFDANNGLPGSWSK